MGRLALMIDLERCTGCKSCEVACKQEHGLGPGAYRNRVVWLGEPGRPGLDFLTVTCQQCERPACLRACPVNPKAIAKDEATGVVRVAESRCTGCGECVLACPYGAMGYDPALHRAVKCDLCADRRAAGRGPACAAVCPGRAIRFGERDPLLAEARAEGRRPVEHDPFLLDPATVYLDRLARGAGPAAATPVPLAPPERRAPAVSDGALGRAPFAAQAVRPPYQVAREARQPDRILPGGCTFCFNCCTTMVHLQGDRVVQITGNEDDPVLGGRVCPKSQLGVQLHGNPHRLTTPLKRVGKRGAGRFEPISWEQALGEIAERLGAVRETWGPEALGIFAGTRTGVITKQGYIRLFGQLWGTPNVEGTDPFCATGKTIAYELVQGRVGSGNSYTPGDLGSAALYLFIGDNQAETRPVYFGMINDWRLRNGARMVVVDPRRTVTAGKADRWLPIRPGTDLALGLAMLHHIFAQGLHDEPFCRANVLGWERWRAFIAERGYTPEWAAPITDLPAAEMRALAEEVARAEGCVIFASRGINQHTNAVQTNRVLMALAAVTGNWGRRGGAFFNMTAGLPIAPDAPPERQRTPQQPKVRRNPTGWTEAMLHGRPYPLKALIACNNPMSNWPGQAEARRAFAALELLVHIELFPNETSAHADYVLPAATGIEQGDIGRSNDDRRVVWVDKMIEPPGEARGDAWIWVELARRFGFEDVLPERYKDPAVFWDEVLTRNPQLRGCTQRRLHSVPYRWVRIPVAAEDAPEQETLYLEGTTAFGAGPGRRFPTPSGKLEFWSEAQEAMFRAVGLSALPEFYSEREQLVDLPHVAFTEDDAAQGTLSPFHKTPTASSPARLVAAAPDGPGAKLRARGYDLELVTGRPPAPHFHSWTHYLWQAQEMWPDLYAQIHPDRARALGIADGDLVRVATAHGAIEARAWLNAGLRPTTVFVPIGWGERQPYHPWRSVNFLTDKTQRDPVSDQTNLKTLLCRVSRA
ncbi:MAG: molybdopterin-dependent oxidoreductase [Candidatus Lambdaproteobacteria bacterium]|nr:molybdopterin-dependent oxidoreductase [Candidatus Lambdaproteobacteria bacterium]